MPRLARFVVPGIALHIVQRGHNRNDCFQHETDRLVYLANLAELLRKSSCALHAYCLMTNHVHLLLTPSTEGSCATLMRNLGQRYAQYFNRRYARRGALWEGRFRSCLVDSVAYVLACHRYIERNPVRASMVERPEAYPWSSYGGNAGRALDQLLTAHAEYLALGMNEKSRERAYQLMLREADEPSFLAAIRDATNGGVPLVGDALKAKLQADTGRRLEHRKPGPPAAGAADVDDLTLDLGF
jgi:putative transposase